MNEQLIVDQPERNSGVLSLSTIGSMMSLAIEKGIDLKELVELHERLKKSAAEEAFNEAMQRFQSDVPVIEHNEQADVKTRDGGKGYSYTFASLAHIAKTIKPMLKECGLSYSFDTKLEKGIISVACTIHHVLGHKRTSTFEAPASGAPGMSEIQKGASTVTYGQRYSLKLALGLMTVDMDDDGRGAGPGGHENPEADPSAPRERPRAQRQAAPPDAVAQRKEALRRVYDAWAAANPDNSDNGDGKAMDRFVAWVQFTSHRSSLNPRQPAKWTAEDDIAFQKCVLVFE